jgi:hypothetical protein
VEARFTIHNPWYKDTVECAWEREKGWEGGPGGLAPAWPVTVEPVRASGCSPGRSNHKGLVSRGRTLPSESCPAKSTKLPGVPALLVRQCFCTFLSSLCASQLVHVVKRKPVWCPCWLGAVLLRASADATGSRSSISPVATHAPRAVDATKAALDPALFPFLHLLAANHWILVLLESPCATTVLDSSIRLKDRHRVHCPHCAAGPGWLFVESSRLPGASRYRSREPTGNPSCGLKYKESVMLVISEEHYLFSCSCPKPLVTASSPGNTVRTQSKHQKLISGNRTEPSRINGPGNHGL